MMLMMLLLLPMLPTLHSPHWAASAAPSVTCAHRPPGHALDGAAAGPGGGASSTFRTGAFAAPPSRRRRRQATAVAGAEPSDNGESEGDNSTTPLRILIQYEASFGSAKDANSVALKRLLEEAVAYWEAALTVRRAPAAFWLPRACRTDQVQFVRSPVTGAFLHYCRDGCSPATYCGHTPVPDAHLDWCREVAPSSDGAAALRHSASRGLGIWRPHNYALYVSAYGTVRCGGPGSQTLAYSAHCQLDGATDRPLAGYVNLCPGRLSGHFAMREEAQYTARHELLHALGLTATLFAFTRLDSGAPRTPRQAATNLPALGMLAAASGEGDSGGGGRIFQWSNDTIVQVSEPWRSARGLFNLTRHYLVTPRVVPRVRAHFNCPSLLGLPLENQGEIGSALTHWEKRLVESELMTAAYTGSSVVSEFTLAFLEDTGWYRANYSMAEPLAWGRGLGCQFATGSCYDWMRRRSEAAPAVDTAAPYCAEVPRYSSGSLGGATMLRTGCSPDGLAKRYCNLAAHPADVPPQYQYFGPDWPPGLLGQQRTGQSPPWSRYAGTSRFADYCPYPQAFTTFASGANGQEAAAAADRTSECRQTLNQPLEAENPTLEVYGPNSACLGQPEPFRLRFCGHLVTATSYGSGCYRVRCSGELGLLLVGLGAGAFDLACPVGGGRLDFSLSGNYSLYYGSLVCPECNRVCGHCRSATSAGGTAPPRLLPSGREPCTPHLRLAGSNGGGGISSAPVTVTPCSRLLIVVVVAVLLTGRLCE